MIARDPGGEKRGFHAAIFFAVFFRVTHDGLSERGTTRSLALFLPSLKISFTYIHYICLEFSADIMLALRLANSSGLSCYFTSYT